MPSMSAARRLSQAATLILSAVGLAGCGGNTTAFAPPCPQLSLLKDAADLTRFNGHGHDLTDMDVSARIVAVPATCKPGGKDRVAAAIRAELRLTRGPALQGRTVTLPYLVTVSDGDTILDQHAYAVSASFPPNVDTMTISDADIPMSFPVTATKTAAAYTIYVSFQLTPDQLAYNRTRGQ